MQRIDLRGTLVSESNAFFTLLYNQKNFRLISSSTGLGPFLSHFRDHPDNRKEEFLMILTIDLSISYIFHLKFKKFIN